MTKVKGITVKQATANLKYLQSLPAHDQIRPSVKSSIKMYKSVIQDAAIKSANKARKSVGAPKDSFVVIAGGKTQAFKGKKVYSK